MLARRNPASTARLKICRFCGSSADLHTNRTNHGGDKQSTRAAAGGGGLGPGVGVMTLEVSTRLLPLLLLQLPP